jgi:hypothetical protein
MSTTTIVVMDKHDFAHYVAFYACEMRHQATTLISMYPLPPA